MSPFAVGWVKRKARSFACLLLLEKPLGNSWGCLQKKTPSKNWSHLVQTATATLPASLPEPLGSHAFSPFSSSHEK